MLRVTLIAALSATFAAAAHAQRPVSAPPSDTSHHTARSDSGSVRAQRLPAVSVQASILPTAAASIGSGVPARMTNVSGAEVNAWHPRVLPDALTREAGISFYDDLGTPWKLNLSTRGFTAGPTVGLPSGITVFLDGVRQNEADAQEINFDLLPLDDVDHIEILSGTASLLGPNSLGGAINLITARGLGPLHGSLSTTVGSFGNREAQADFSGRTAGRWDYLASGQLSSENGWRQATSDHHYSVFANMGHDDGTSGIRIQVLASRSRAQTAGSLPESMFNASPQVNFTPGDFEDLNAQQLSVAAHTTRAFGSLSANLFGRRSTGQRFNVNQTPDPNVRGFTNDCTAGGTLDWRWTRLIGAGALALRGGVDGAANRVRVRIFNEANPGLGETANSNDSNGDAAASPLGLTTDVQSPSWNIAGYLLGDYQLGPVTLSGGARLDRLDIPFRNLLNSDDNATSDYTRANPRAGVSVDVGRGALVYASVGSGFRAPAILELGCADPTASCPLPFALGDDPPLRPVRSKTYEAGARWGSSHLSLNASAYRIDVNDEIFFVESPGALLSGYFTNVDRTRRTGFEVSADGQALTRHANWYVNYAYTRATFESPAQIFSIRSNDDFENSALSGSNRVVPGDAIPLVPAHQAKAGASLNVMHGITAGVDLRYIGQQWLRGDEANETTPLPAYALANARLGTHARGWDVSLVITNLFDTHRAIFGTFNENRRTGELERFLTPMNARGVSFELRRSFGAE